MTKRGRFLQVIGLLIAIGSQAQPMDKRFEEFRDKEKFTEDVSVFYPGIADEKLRAKLTELTNEASLDFENAFRKANSEDSDYLEAIKTGLARFSSIYVHLDTEDRERICLYFEELMDIVGLESSNGQLNTFMYGFDPAQR